MPDHDSDPATTRLLPAGRFVCRDPASRPISLAWNGTATPNPNPVLAAGTADRLKGFGSDRSDSMLPMKERRAAIRTRQGWAISVLLDAPRHPRMRRIRLDD